MSECERTNQIQRDGLSCSPHRSTVHCGVNGDFVIIVILLESLSLLCEGPDVEVENHVGFGLAGAQ